jgi:hypothetical protein
MPEPSRRSILLKLKMDMVYRGIEPAKAEARFNENVSLPPIGEKQQPSESKNEHLLPTPKSS